MCRRCSSTCGPSRPPGNASAPHPSSGLRAPSPKRPSRFSSCRQCRSICLCRVSLDCAFVDGPETRNTRDMGTREQLAPRVSGSLGLVHLHRYPVDDQTIAPPSFSHTDVGWSGAAISDRSGWTFTKRWKLVEVSLTIFRAAPPSVSCLAADDLEIDTEMADTGNVTSISSSPSDVWVPPN